MTPRVRSALEALYRAVDRRAAAGDPPVPRGDDAGLDLLAEMVPDARSGDRTPRVPVGVDPPRDAAAGGRASVTHRLSRLYGLLHAERARNEDREARLVAQAWRSALLADAVRSLAGALEEEPLRVAVAEGAHQVAQGLAARLWVAGTGTRDDAVTVVGDVPTEDDALPTAVPLVSGGQTLGTLEVWLDPDVPAAADLRASLQVLAAAGAAAVQAASLHARLAERSTRDGLTNLFNRRRLEEDLDLEEALHRRHGQPYALVVADLDRFKDLNDARGHLEGDEALRAVARLLEETPRASDAAYRFGGEEFVLLLRNQDAESGRRVAERLRALAATRLEPWGLTASFGVAGCPEHGAAAQDVLRRADGALYEAKRTGRDRVAVAADVDVRRPPRR